MKCESSLQHCNHANSIGQWLDLFTSSIDAHRPALIDIRPTFVFESEHVIHSTHFDGLYGTNGLSNRLSELPPPQHRRNIAVIASTPEQAAEATSWLHDKGFRDVLSLSISDIASFVQMETGRSSARLWSPAPIVENALPLIASHISPRVALDIGAGAGRDTAFLVERGFRVTAVDRDPLLLEKCIQLVNRYSSGLSGSVHTIVRTFGANFTDDAEFFRSNASSLLVVVRFLRRGVLDLLWHAVAPNGFVLYEHFLDGCQHLGGPVKQSQLLRPGELRTVFSEARGFTVLRDEKAALSDGRPVARFIAKRDRTVVCHPKARSS